MKYTNGSAAKVLLLTLLLLLQTAAFAQEFNFRTWSLKEGLPKPGIYALLEDRQGYLWIGSEGGGLIRFDGLNFDVYTQRDGLGNNTVRCLIEDSKGAIWAGTDGNGISRFYKNNLTNYREGFLSGRIRALAEDSTGAIWAGTMGGGLHQMKDGEIRHYGISEGLPSNNIRALLSDSQGNLWIGTDGGLVKKTADGFKTYGIRDGIFPSKILCLFEDSKGRVWFGTGRGAGYHKEGYFYLLTTSDGLPHQRIRAIAEDATGNIWLGTMDGAGRYDGDSFENFREENGLSYNRIRSIVKDAQGNMWFGTYFGGLCQFRDKRFAYYNVGNEAGTIIQGLTHEPVKDQLWLGTWDGLFAIDPASGAEMTHFDTLNGLIHQVVNCVAPDSEGGLWIGYDKEGLSKLKNGRFTHLATSRESAASAGLPYEHLEQMHYDGRGKLWLIWRDGQVGRLEKGNYINYSQRLNIEEKAVLTLNTNKRGDTWIGTSGGGLLHVSPSGTLNTYDQAHDGLADNTVTAIGIHKSAVWAGGPHGALSCLSSGQVTTYPEISAQLGSGITNLEVDPEGHLWVTMDNGVAKISLDEGKIIQVDQYDEKTGFLGISSLPGGVTLDASGVLWMGTLNGLTAYNPSEAQENASAPKIHLTGISLLDETESVADYATELNNKNVPLSMDLPFRLNDLMFHFDGISLKYPEQVRYSWKIQGHQDQWSPASQSNTATYSRIPPGNYTFQVRATNETGLWSEAASIPFHISRPWWNSWWFYGLCALALAGIVSFFIRMRTAGLEKQKANLESMVQERTTQLEQQTQRAELARERAEYSEQIKEQFLANMSHEIRTPMNAIVGMTKLLIEKEPKQSQLEYLDAISQSSDNLLVIINDILDISKIEAGKMTFEQIDFSLPRALKNIYQTLRHKAEEKELDFVLVTDERVPEWVKGDPTRLSQILINLAGNAIKFTGKGKVEIRCTTLVSDKAKSKLKFEVIDTGIGIPIDQQDKLFESFTQASSETTRQFGGTGLGLSISKQLVELQGGEIEMTSEEGKGSNFYFTIFYSHGEPQENTAESEAERGEKLAASLPKGIRILLVEDNPFNQMVAVDTLESKLDEVKISVAENGKIGLEMAEAEQFDLVLMDLQMPEMDGFAATEAIRASDQPTTEALPIMAMTAGATQAEMERCKAVGMDDFITKPFDIAVLLEKIASLLQLKTSD